MHHSNQKHKDAKLPKNEKGDANLMTKLAMLAYWKLHKECYIFLRNKKIQSTEKLEQK